VSACCGQRERHPIRRRGPSQDAPTESGSSIPDCNRGGYKGYRANESQASAPAGALPYRHLTRVHGARACLAVGWQYRLRLCLMGWKARGRDRVSNLVAPVPVPATSGTRTAPWLQNSPAQPPPMACSRLERKFVSPNLTLTPHPTHPWKKSSRGCAVDYTHWSAGTSQHESTSVVADRRHCGWPNRYASPVGRVHRADDTDCDGDRPSVKPDDGGGDECGTPPAHPPRSGRDKFGGGDLGGDIASRLL
jgi:hypothetical protein